MHDVVVAGSVDDFDVDWLSLRNGSSRTLQARVSIEAFGYIQARRQGLRQTRRCI
jgi:hypothetical protein